MSNFQKTISYAPYRTTDTWRVWIFWVIIFVVVFFLLTYIFSIYETVDLSYQIENEQRSIKKENQVYQEVEERYAAKLESLREEGRALLGLALPKTHIFIDRYGALARTGL